MMKDVEQADKSTRSSKVKSAYASRVESRRESISKGPFLHSAFALVLLVIGAISLQKCPVEPFLPIAFVIYGGLTVVACVIYAICLACRCTSLLTVALEDTITGAGTIVMLVASVVVVMRWTGGGVSYDPASPLYCDQIVWILGAVYVVLSLIAVIVVPCLLCACFCCVGALAVAAVAVEEEEA